MRDKRDTGPRAITKMAVAAGLSLMIISLALQAGAWSPAAVSVAASNGTSAALLDDGTVWQWGCVLGNAVRAPVQVDISGVRQISAGNGHVIALKSDGTAWAWGSR
jgi:alpha-tubulin suppressor-like RCC1 family protein